LKMCARFQNPLTTRWRKLRYGKEFATTSMMPRSSWALRFADPPVTVLAVTGLCGILGALHLPPTIYTPSRKTKFDLRKLICIYYR